MGGSLMPRGEADILSDSFPPLQSELNSGAATRYNERRCGALCSRVQDLQADTLMNFWIY